MAMLPVMVVMEKVPGKMFEDGARYDGVQWCGEKEAVNQLFISGSVLDEDHIRDLRTV